MWRAKAPAAPWVVIGVWAIVLVALQLLGKANWYLPPILSWLPEIRTEGAEQGSSSERLAGGAEAS